MRSPTTRVAQAARHDGNNGFLCAVCLVKMPQRTGQDVSALGGSVVIENEGNYFGHGGGALPS
jgi:hypothetical protein